MGEIVTGLLGLGIIIWFLIALFGTVIPCVIAAVVMSNKGQSGGLGALLGFFLSWIGVIVACCMRDLKDEERKHRETLSVMTLQRDSVSSSPPLPPLPSSVPDFRSEAIRNLKAAGKEFDEYDIELEINRLRSKHQKAEALRRKNLEHERILGVVSSSGVVPPPLPISAPLLSSSPPPLPVTAVAELAEAAEVAEVPPLLPGGFAVPPLADRDEPDFRIEAIRNLKSTGKVFDEYDIELEMENQKSEYFRMLEIEERRKEWERKLEEESFLHTHQEESESQSSDRPQTLAEKFCRERAAGSLRNRVIY
jgi:predicted outer membrane protein